jgi:hypothetical protein
VTLRDGLLPVFESARTLIDNLGLRTTRVIRRTRTWSGGEVGLGDLVETDLELAPRPKVRNGGPGLVIVGPVTPEYAGGGYGPDDLAPDQTAAQEVIWILVGADGEEMPYRWAATDSRRAFRYMLTLAALDDEDPRFG